MSRLELSTEIDTFFHARPPLPKELVVSSTNSSQSRMDVGADIATTGELMKSGLSMEKVLGTVVAFQETVAVQFLIAVLQ